MLDHISGDLFSARVSGGLRDKLMDKRGFTLVEVIIASGLLMLALSMAYSFMLSSVRFYKEAVSRSEKQGQMRVILAGLKEELKTADAADFWLIREEDISAIITDASFLTGPSGRRLYYFDVSAGKFYVHHSSEPARRVAFVDLDLPGFDLRFELDDANDKIVDVYMSSEGVKLSGHLALLNATAEAYGAPGASGEVYRGVILSPAK